MFKIDLIVVGKVKKGPWYDLQEDYIKRLRWNVTLIEVESKYTDSKTQQEHEQRLVLSKLDEDSFIIVLDERGDGLKSLDFSRTLERLASASITKLTFLIGGAEGFTDEIRGKANMLLSFGQQTWPHVMVRVMLLEQIYRAQQILAGHPYHREG
ncbi:MAG TPA: 23S rRNA (pseudouridine(1915)-N(3))-methyltransferase RlmH [Alphaproteobacteria bacterium]|nr:23S rRNA (pseudouridine(1915)-N(3))-methyltransferase RlmH [Alphaproteobacteria bacterium]HNS45376.1 23S rRNA (pseudouridine(1915)-N(3))-methyltransferase RlmH [Alphaproteobacteria bacterium]